MARPVQIEREKALKAARLLFWSQGYTATSMAQLLHAMSIGSGSFYTAFESKAELFKRVVDDYRDWSINQFTQVRTNHKGLDAVRLFLDRTLVDISNAGRRKGCLLVNSVLELDDVDQELYQHARNALKNLDLAFRDCVDEASAVGKLNRHLTEVDAVRLLSTQVQGLRVESRLGLSKAEARQRVAVLIDLISTV